jgi:Domain of unknown function (DUF4112)
MAATAARTPARRAAPRTIHVITDKDAELARIEKFATLLDSQFTIPGTDVKFGLEAIAGLVPVVGDIIGFVCSAVIYHQLKQLDLPAWTRFRMGWNIAIDTLAGIVPVLGDIFDVAFKANMKNIELARRALAKEKKRLR